MQFEVIPYRVEAITFDEFVAEGLKSAPVVANGMPWHFEFKGHAITHETDDCYLIPSYGAVPAMQRLTRNDMLIIGAAGDLHVKSIGTFNMQYRAIEAQPV